jgi:predicted nucleic acid-binding protein
VARARRTRQVPPGVTDILVLDADGVTKAAAGDKRVAAWLERARELDADVLVSAVTIAEIVRGVPRDAKVNRVVKAADVVPADEAIGRSAGALLGRAGSRPTVDALVAATATAAVGRVPVSRCIVLSSDPGDLRALLGDEVAVQVIAV